MALLKSTPTKFVTITGAIAAGTYSFQPGEVLEVYGALPPELEAHVRECAAPAGPVRKFDRAEYDLLQAIANAPRPGPAREVTLAELLKKFSWTMADFELAKGFNFPIGARRSRGRFPNVTDTLVWPETVVQDWHDTLRTLVHAR